MLLASLLQRFEGSPPNGGDAVRDRVVTAFSSRKLNQKCFVFVEQNPALRSIFGNTFANLNASQAAVAREDIIPNASDAVGDHHARQANAYCEGIIPNGGDHSRGSSRSSD